MESPAALRCENGRFWATIVWSSSNFDYMKVDGEKAGAGSGGGGGFLPPQAGKRVSRRENAVKRARYFC